MSRHFINILMSDVTGDPIPPESAEWAAELIRRSFSQGFPVDRVLAPLRRNFRYALRDDALARALEIAGSYERLIARINLFECGRWRHWKNEGLGEDASELDTELYKAFSTGLRIPRSKKQLERLMNNP